MCVPGRNVCVCFGLWNPPTASLPNCIWKWNWKWRDIRPSMVTHTRNLCSAFDPSKVHTHSSEHTPGAVGSHLCCGTWGAVGGSVPCSRAPQSWYWGWRESAVHSLPPPTIPAGPETRTRNLWITSPTLSPLGHDFWLWAPRVASWRKTQRISFHSSSSALVPVGVINLATCICVKFEEEGPDEKTLSNILNLDCNT